MFEIGQQYQLNKQGKLYTVTLVYNQIEIRLLRSDGWELIAHNPQLYESNGKQFIKWSFSTGGHFIRNYEE